MQIKTHEVDDTGKQCRVCGFVLPIRKPAWSPNTLVGVIEGEFFNTVVYKIGLNDSNSKCEKLEKLKQKKS